MSASKSNLKAPLPAVATAMEELCEVLTGGAYTSADFWDAADETAASTYMDGLTLNAGLEANLDKVFGKVPGVKEAMGQAKNAINSFITEVAATSSQVTGDVIPAINHLNNPHGGSYPTTELSDKGFIPALLGIGTAATLDMGGVQNAINTAVGVANDAVSYARFTLLATKTVEKLTAAMA